MNIDELYDMLEISSGDEFEYFENIADLIETDIDLVPETLYALLKDVDKSNFKDLAKTYFDEIQEHMPEDSTDVYTIIENVKRGFMGLSTHKDDGSNLMYLSEEICRFIEWYNKDDNVEVRNADRNEIYKTSIKEALLEYRVSRLENKELAFDFENALYYEIEEYAMTFADMDKEIEQLKDSEEDYNESSNDEYGYDKYE